MTDPQHGQPGPLELEEYRALRDVIGRRGSLRTVLIVTTVVAWAVIAALVASLVVAMPLAFLLSLLVLVAGFEAAHALHIGAERIGRYLYVRYESVGAGTAGARTPVAPMWEAAIAAFEAGRLPFGGRPSGAHFAPVFILATLTNLALASLSATPVERAAMATIHALVIARIALARTASRNQRRDDQAEFERILR